MPSSTALKYRPTFDRRLRQIGEAGNGRVNKAESLLNTNPPVVSVPDAFAYDLLDDEDRARILRRVRRQPEPFSGPVGKVGNAGIFVREPGMGGSTSEYR
jgi:hypothetical protein